MKKFQVTCTIIYNGSVEIEAEDSRKAMDMAASMMNYENLSVLPDSVKVGEIDFNFGEGTADYADEI